MEDKRGENKNKTEGEEDKNRRREEDKKDKDGGKIHSPDILLRHLLDGDPDLCVEVPRGVHHPVRPLPQHHPLATVVQLILILRRGVCCCD